MDVIASARDLLQQYDNVQLTSPSRDNQALLAEAWELLSEPALSPAVSRELVELAFAILWRRHALEDLVVLLENYLRQSLEPEDEAWGRWNLVDMLAVAGRCDEAVAAQKSFISWAKASLPPADLPQVLRDSTQLACWYSLGLLDEWIEVFWELMKLIEITEFNRQDRFELVTTARMALEIASGPSEARKAFRLAEAILQEEGGEWEMRFLAEGKFLVYKAALTGREGDVDGMRQQFQSIDEWLSNSGRTDSQLRDMWHQLGSTTYWAGQYDLAIRAFERAASFEGAPGHTYLWHAAAIWKTTSDRSRVCELLSEAGTRLGVESEKVFLAANEFEDAADDVEFREALGLDRGPR